MGFVVRASGGGDFAQHPAGVFAARCTRIIDLGTQNEDFQGKPKKSHKVIFFFETTELMPDGEMAGKPFLVNKEYTASLGEKATLRKDLESWRGRKFSDPELEGFDIKNVLGKPVMLNIVEYQKRNGGNGVKISAMMPLPAGMSANAAVGDLILFSLYDDEGNVKPLDTATYEKLSKFWQGKIAQSEEWIEATGGKPKAPATAGGFDDMDDDIPF